MTTPSTATPDPLLEFDPVTRNILSPHRPVPPGLQPVFDWLSGLVRPGIKYELSKVRRLLDRLGSPHRDLTWIQVVGSNGKGSTAAYMVEILSRAGLRVGLFTSPHLVSLRERIRIGRTPIEPAELARCGEVLARAVASDRELSVDPPSFFEAVFAMACLHFGSRHVDLVVAEAGLGGRLDATTAVDPVLTVFTNVSLDHERILGSTPELILAEKVAVARPGVPMVCGIEDPGLRKLVEDHCDRVGAPLIWPPAPLYDSSARWAFRREASGPLIVPGLAGRHQQRNAALAVAALDALPGGLCPSPSPAAAAEAVAATRWPARFQILDQLPARPGSSGPVILDGGHNVAGMRATLETHRELFGGVRTAVVVGFSGDKRLEEMLAFVLELDGPLVITRSTHWRAADTDRIAAAVTRLAPGRPFETVDQPDSAVIRALDLCPPGAPLLITGSLYLLGEILATEVLGPADGLLGLDLGGTA